MGYVAAESDLVLDLGIKGQFGMLQSRQTRATFLADPTHGRVFYFTPKHAFWMNRIEIWFSILVRKLLKRGHFKLRAKTRLHEIEQTLLGASSNDDHFPVLKMRKVICLHCLHC